MQTEPLHLVASSSKSKPISDGTVDVRSSAEAAAVTISQDSKIQPGQDDRSVQVDHIHDHHYNLIRQEYQQRENSKRSFTYDAFRRHPCCCADSVWLCNDCGRTLNSATLMYRRGWLWRKRYSDYLGGQKSGIGEGSEGVHCGREMYCLDAKEVEHVIEWNDRSKSVSNADEDLAIHGDGIDNHASFVSGPAVAGAGAGGSNANTSDYIEVGDGLGNGGGDGSNSNYNNSSDSSTSTSTSATSYTIDQNHSHHHHHHYHHNHHDNDNYKVDAHVHINHINNIDTNANARANARARPRHEPSYLAREVEGIGGVVRRTTSHRERIGAIVPEYEGERATGQYLSAEREGRVRSWCSWCFRVVPGVDDEREGLKED